MRHPGPSKFKETNLAVGKRIINLAAKLVLQMLPEVEATFPDTMVLAQRLDKLIEEAVKEETHTDGKFTDLLRAMKRTVVYLAENDSYYHRWLCTAMGLFDGCYDDIDNLFNDAQVCGNYNKVTMWRRLRMSELEKLQNEYDELRKRCNEYRERDSCGMPTIFTMGCGECILSRSMKGIRSKMKKLREG